MNITLRMLGLFVNEWPEADGNMIWRFQRQEDEKGLGFKESRVRVIKHLIPRSDLKRSE